MNKFYNLNRNEFAHEMHRLMTGKSVSLRTAVPELKILKIIFKCIQDELARGGTVEIYGFAKFSIYKKGGYTTYNFKTGEIDSDVPARVHVGVSFGEPVNDAVNKLPAGSI